MKIAIYGAEPKPRAVPTPIHSFVQHLKRMRAFRIDAKSFKAGDLTSLDYRNYVSSSTINQGDVAIAQSAALLVLSHKPDAAIDLIRWGELDDHKSTWSDFVIAGSGYVTFDQKGCLSKRLIDDLDFFHRHRIEPILLGIGINQPKAAKLNHGDIDIHPAAASDITKLLSISKTISVRDSFTQTILSNYTNKRIELAGDPALHFSRLHGIRRTTPSALQRGRPLIGLNLNFHGPSSTKLLQRNLPIFASAIKWLRDKHNCDFRYFVHFDASLVIPKLLALDGLEMEVIKGGPETLAKHYGELDLHIGGMLHSCILAHSVGTPAIALAYDIKHRGFMELFDLERNCLPAADLTVNAIIDRASEVLANRDLYRNAISTTCERLEKITHDFVQTSLSST